MKTRTVLAGLSAAILLAQGAARAEGAQASGKARPFHLEDQYGGSYDAKFPAAKPLVLVFGHKAIFDPAKKWELALKQELRDKADVKLIVPIGVSWGPMKSIIKAHLKDQPAFLVDWGCKVAEGYAFDTDKKAPKVFVIDPQGGMVATEEANYSKEGFDRVVKSLAAEPVKNAAMN